MSFPYRVLAVYGQNYLLLMESGERLASIGFPLADAPVVGDFVSLRDGFIDAVLPRRSVIRRVAPGGGHAQQILAANIDLLFIVCGLDGDFNLRRMERYLILALDSGTRPVFVLTKADLCVNPEGKLRQVEEIAGTHPVILSSSADGAGAERMRELLGREVTAALIGSSGAGKSTLMNLLLGEGRQAVSDVRAGDSRGRHTTTHRQMFAIPGGGWLVDQPGLREIQIAADEATVEQAFPEIAVLASQCRFRDCRHQSEPGCAVRGSIDQARLHSFEKLQRESRRADEENDPVGRRERKAKVKVLHKAMRGHYRK